jgi:SET domain-containing protein
MIMARVMHNLETMKLIVSTIDWNRTIRRNRQQENDTINILIDYSFYPDACPIKRQKLLDYLVSSYFDPLLHEKNRPSLK